MHDTQPSGDEILGVPTLSTRDFHACKPAKRSPSYRNTDKKTQAHTHTPCGEMLSYCAGDESQERKSRKYGSRKEG